MAEVVLVQGHANLQNIFYPAEMSRIAVSQGRGMKSIVQGQIFLSFIYVGC